MGKCKEEVFLENGYLNFAKSSKILKDTKIYTKKDDYEILP